MRCSLPAEYVYMIPSFHCEDHISQIPEETYSGLRMAGFTVFASPIILQPQCFPLSRVFTGTIHAYYSLHFQCSLARTGFLEAIHLFQTALSSTTRLILQENAHHLVLHVYPPLMAPHYLEDKPIVHRAKHSLTRSLPFWLIWAEQCAFLLRAPPFSPHSNSSSEDLLEPYLTHEGFLSSSSAELSVCTPPAWHSLLPVSLSSLTFHLPKFYQRLWWPELCPPLSWG